VSHTGAESTSPAPRRRRSIFRDDSADTALPGSWALAEEPSAPGEDLDRDARDPIPWSSTERRHGPER